MNPPKPRMLAARVDSDPPGDPIDPSRLVTPPARIPSPGGESRSTRQQTDSLGVECRSTRQESVSRRQGAASGRQGRRSTRQAGDSRPPLRAARPARRATPLATRVDCPTLETDSSRRQTHAKAIVCDSIPPRLLMPPPTDDLDRPLDFTPAVHARWAGPSGRRWSIRAHSSAGNRAQWGFSAPLRSAGVPGRTARTEVCACGLGTWGRGGRRWPACPAPGAGWPDVETLASLEPPQLLQKDSRAVALRPCVGALLDVWV